MLAGYRHPAYAASLGEFGEPLTLARSGGSLLVRPLACGDRDAMGPYPVFACTDWTALPDDLAELDLVSVTLVTDPFGDWTVELLDAAFPDRRVAFKEHYVVELSGDPVSLASSHHRRFAARGLRKVAVERVARPPDLLDEWVALYGELVRRHAITGVSAFSRAAFARQLEVPGITAFRAVAGGELAGAALWYVDAGVAHWHLAAYSALGYKLDASYALLATALEFFAGDGVRWASLGAGAGLSAEPTDGLSRFKAGWATGTRTVHLCGRILDPERYAALGGPPGTRYFPAYRADSMASR